MRNRIEASALATADPPVSGSPNARWGAILVQQRFTARRNAKATVGVLVLLLAGCGGGGGDGAPPGGGSQNPPLQDGPDLLPTGITFSQATVAAGSALAVSDVVENIGTRMTGQFSIAIYLSSDDVIDSTDRILGFRSLADLPFGQSSSGGGTVTIPGDTQPGTYFVGVIADEFQEVLELEETNNTLASVDTLEVTASTLPNLQSTQVETLQTTLVAGDSLVVTDTVRNTGLGAASSFVVGIFLSDDPMITSADTLVGVRSVPSLLPAEESTATGPITIPLSTPEGMWYVGVIVDSEADVQEAEEFDNTGVAPQLIEITAPPVPDLVADQLTFSPPLIEIGQLLDVTESVRNGGLGVSGATTVGIYLSEDATVSIADRELGTRLVPSLAVGESSSNAGQYMIPPGILGGDYHVGVIADPGSVVNELAELNNVLVSVGMVTVEVPPLADLLMSGFSFSPGVVNAGIGDTITIQDTVLNQGAVGSGSFRVSFYLSNNTAITASDLLLGSRTVAGLAVGESSTAVTELEVPSTIPGGSWFVGALADDLDVVLEATNGNNAIFSGSALDVVSSEDPMPDLEMTSLSFSPSTAVAGSTIQFLDRVQNSGTLSSGTFHVGVYLSEDMEVTTDDLLIAERIVFNLAIDFGSASSFSTILPNDLPAGDYYVAAIADNRGVVDEADEDNNTFTTVGRMEIFVPPPPMPDLRVLSSSLDPTTVSAGETIMITDTVSNTGNLAASSAIRVGYYLSEDAEVTTADTLIGSRLLGALGPDEESNSTSQFTVPAGLAPGTWTVGILVDDLEIIVESDEDNNTHTIASTLEIQ